jgi:predicted ATP-dependent serine protease
VEKLGFQKVICPRLSKNVPVPKTLKVQEVKTVLELMKVLLEKKNNSDIL